MGLFDKKELDVLAPPPGTDPRCHPCGLFKTCKAPKLKAAGMGKKRILVLGDFPSTHDDEQARHFAGPAGRALETRLARNGIDLRRDCWLDFGLMCRPPGGRIPDAAQWVGHCRPHVIGLVQSLKPVAILALGYAAVQSVLGWLWGEDVGSIFRWAGYRIPHRGLNAWVCPTFAPDFLTYAKNDPVMERMFDAHVAAACQTAKRGPPHGDSGFKETGRIEVCLSDEEAVMELRRMERAAKVCAFDYETTTLKPDGEYAEIFTCSFAYNTGGRDVAFAFPWRGRAAEIAARIITTPHIEKVGQNIKFEDRWTRAKLGRPVAGWRIGEGKSADPMLGCHALENGTKSRRITGIEFQAFVKLGASPWSGTVERFLKGDERAGKCGNAENRIREAPLPDLLEYNAIDSLYELQVGRSVNLILNNDNKKGPPRAAAGGR